jgi:hypothetical protein
MTSEELDTHARTVLTEQLPVIQSTAIKLRERLRQWHKKGDEVLKAADQEPDRAEFKSIYNDWIADLQHVARCSGELSSLVRKLGVDLPPLAEALRELAIN